MSLFWAYLLLEVCRKAILEWHGVLFLLWCSHCRVIQARMLDLWCCAIQFLLTFSWTCPKRKLQFAHGCTLRMCQGTSDPFSKLLVLQSILLRCIAITPPACKEWELMHVNGKQALLNEASCFDCLFDCSVDLCGLKHICLALGEVGTADGWYHQGMPARGWWCGRLALQVPDQAFLGV
jgi:hypothetical protein